MFNLQDSKSIRTFTVGLTTILVFASSTSFSLAKPSNWSYKIGNSIKFDFKGCTKSGDDIVCVGNFRSRSGERLLHIGTGFTGGLSPKLISITDSRGKVSFADEVRVGEEWSFTENGRSVGDITLVEGVDYKTLFIFKDVSLPSLKIPLFSAQSDHYFGSADRFEIKARNIPIPVAETKQNQ